MGKPCVNEVILPYPTPPFFRLNTTSKPSSVPLELVSFAFRGAGNFLFVIFLFASLLVSLSARLFGCFPILGFFWFYLYPGLFISICPRQAMRPTLLRITLCIMTLAYDWCISILIIRTRNCSPMETARNYDFE